MKLFLIELAFLGYTETSLAEQDVLMTYPGPGQVVDAFGRTITFRWKGEADAKYKVEFYLRDSQKPTREVYVTGNSLVVKVSTLSPIIRWRVTPADVAELKSETLYRVYLAETEELRARMFTGVANSTTTISSAAVNDKISVRGAISGFAVTYAPRRWQNKYSFTLNYRRADLSGDSEEVQEQRLGFEAGLRLENDATSAHLLNLGYIFMNQLNFQSRDLDADYDVNFLTLRYQFQKSFQNNWYGELGLDLQIPFPYTFKPSVVVKPLVGYNLSPYWRLEGFVFYEKYVSEPLDNSDRKVEIEMQNTGAGLGLSYRLF